MKRTDRGRRNESALTVLSLLCTAERPPSPRAHIIYYYYYYYCRTGLCVSGHNNNVDNNDNNNNNRNAA